MFSIPTHSPLCNLFLSPLIEQNNNILSLSSTVIGSLTLPRCPKSLYLSALLEKSKTPSALWVCACLFLRLCVSLCVAGRQKVTVSNGPDLEVGSCCICVRALVFRVCVRGCASPHDDGDSWKGTGQRSAPFRPDALVTSWPCSLLSTCLSTQQEVAGEGIRGGWNQPPVLEGWPLSLGYRHQSKCHGCKELKIKETTLNKCKCESRMNHF